jgi:RNA polymerase sigma-70 factor, ECF subfamily
MTAMTHADASSEAFSLLVDRHRPELLAHCYRLLGSIHDAEDALQEALVRAWRGYAAFEGRSSVRTWLYRIATNACLRLLEQRDRRPLLEPFPDALLSSAALDPAAVTAARSGLRLTVIAALQQLPVRQRTVFILRDVLGWRAAEVASLLDASVISVNSALQRAREQVRELSISPEDAREPAARADQALVDRYATAIEEADASALVALLTEDATFEMPPIPAWYRGRPAIGRFFETRILTSPGRFTLVKITANGQPAFAVYQRADDGTREAHGIQVLTTAGPRITGITAFLDPSLFPLFGQPPALAQAPGR